VNNGLAGWAYAEAQSLELISGVTHERHSLIPVLPLPRGTYFALQVPNSAHLLSLPLCELDMHGPRVPRTCIVHVARIGFTFTWLRDGSSQAHSPPGSLWRFSVPTFDCSEQCRLPPGNMLIRTQ
jgi:hypothetical protein